MEPDNAAGTVALLDSMSADELVDELADRLRDGYDEDGLWAALRYLAGKANRLLTDADSSVRPPLDVTGREHPLHESDGGVPVTEFPSEDSVDATHGAHHARLATRERIAHAIHRGIDVWEARLVIRTDKDAITRERLAEVLPELIEGGICIDVTVERVTRRGYDPCATTVASTNPVPLAGGSDATQPSGKWRPHRTGTEGV